MLYKNQRSYRNDTKYILHTLARCISNEKKKTLSCILVSSVQEFHNSCESLFLLWIETLTDFAVRFLDIGTTAVTAIKGTARVVVFVVTVTVTLVLRVATSTAAWF